MSQIVFRIVVAVALLCSAALPLSSEENQISEEAESVEKTKPLEETQPLYLTVLNVGYYHDWRQIKNLIEVLPHVAMIVPEKESFGMGEYRVEISQPPQEFFEALERNFGQYYDMELHRTAGGDAALTMRKNPQKKSD
ncbi:MAG: hypothetical protein A3I75_00035 [Deltaproteobacteria bacterium RIFCSPLOWO2_02_FULL_50_16]|nr:MAG: hypothetical protein A2053_04875 [Deltaproteobacteria bacterium GWA2_50_8]OGQ27523.1 MAG: hypothetical protein A3B79_07610 [Deltaproteobacteria bacterium RIFCSPHIGHO2_02_FULL_50_15]OGQ58183.1 MAG: hypothetical protein A3I75_00035 [Deltaproteobacteria bacterium RIFCSPLOWO2_02_FULL_50_16]OGQ66862.1 MAG: hypothetical protein A3F89_06355 [Deltaproteobacteria bacterium RIFCSPLOWO2_12_FULL_50_11]